MKTLYILLILLMWAVGIKAQTFDEWFRQKKTQRKYLLQQISALKVYANYLDEGYKIAKEGLGLIEQFKNGELGLHTRYFNALKNVNPVIRNLPIVKEAILIHFSTQQIVTETEEQLKRNKTFDLNERKYLQLVFQRIDQGNKRLVDELFEVLEDGKLEMTDDERLNRINKMHQQLTQVNVFAVQFCQDALILEKNKEREQKDLKTRMNLLNTDKDQ
ncbi:hypothetical protein [Solitalea lacus]|uniref:hypothetical protein n=1 Tax=Solitalea lacus TaxID=2911172 RepID=UPI001EDA5FEA|nr:hypothetical protein [Solitalea lacus]UKJ09226.1 hypothetical protein L2B55_08725 [Solitalea lacus]